MPFDGGSPGQLPFDGATTGRMPIDGAIAGSWLPQSWAGAVLSIAFAQTAQLLEGAAVGTVIGTATAPDGYTLSLTDDGGGAVTLVGDEVRAASTLVAGALAFELTATPVTGDPIVSTVSLFVSQSFTVLQFSDGTILQFSDGALALA